MPFGIKAKRIPRDMRNIKKPMASFEYLDQTQGGSDGVVLEASTDDGITWTIVGGLATREIVSRFSHSCSWLSQYSIRSRATGRGMP